MTHRPSWFARCALLLCGGWVAGCAGSPLSSKTEDEARILVPVPICLQRLPRRGAPGSIVSLSPSEYWSLLLPGFDSGASTLDLAAPDCSGRLTLGEAPTGSAGRTVHADELVLGTGADGFRIAWLPVRANDATRSGLLALLRQRQDYLEVYGLGIYQGSLRETRFSMERMGTGLVVTALEEHCRGADAARRCDASCTVYLLGNGRLSAKVRFPVDHSVDASVAAAAGAAEYRFSASAEYKSDGVALNEKLSVTEKGRGEVRSLNLQRFLRLSDGNIVPSSESLWAQTARQLGLPESP